MSWSKLRGNVRKAALAATLALAGGGVAHAIVYTGSWDPPFGAALPQLSFSGVASLYIPDACLTRNPNSSSGFVSNFSSCTDVGGQQGADPMRLISASVTLTGSGASETLDFLQNISGAALANLVFGVYIAFDPTNALNGMLTGASTDEIGPRTGTIAASMSPGGVSNDFYLRFGPDPFTIGRAAGVDATEADYQKAYLRAVNRGQNVVSNPAAVTFQAVPEPASLALVFAALGAAWLGLRRRQH